MKSLTPVARDNPLMIAWNKYKETPEYTNTKKWATEPEHCEGSLWAAFEAGFKAKDEMSRVFIDKLENKYPLMLADRTSDAWFILRRMRDYLTWGTQ